MLRPNGSFVLAVVALAGVLAGCASTTTAPEAEQGFTVRVVSEPGQAVITLKGREVGRTPLSLEVISFADLTGIEAELPEQTLVERRLHISQRGTAEITFRFGGQVSPVVQALGLSKVVIFDYSERATFDTDSAELKPEFEAMLAEQAELLNTYFAGIEVYVCGHTDDTGTADHNLVLSLERAEAVSDFLVARGVSRSRIKTQGFGQDYPIASNADQAGRALNRRTEVLLPQ